MTDTPMTPEYEQQIRSHVAEMSNYSLGNLFARDLLAEVDRLRLRVDEVERAYIFDTAALKKRVAELAALKPARFQDCQVCGAGYEYGKPCSACEFKKWMAAAQEPAPSAACRCNEPDADPYACEADDCTAEFSELNPFGSGARPVNVASAEVSRKCSTCGWATSVWHVDDGSAEEELHRHTAREHGGTP